MNRSFIKMHGAGNDFIVLDGRTSSLPWTEPEAIAKLADRRTGIGCEGFLLLLPAETPHAAFRLVFLNPDGHEAELCGNGTRCAAHIGYRLGLARERAFWMETGAGLVHAEVLKEDPVEGLVRIQLRPATLPETRTLVLGDGSTVECVFVNSGVPHAVVFGERVEALDVERLGREIRFHAAFAPRGTNVDFVERVGSNALFMRTYERGVEAESGACGTGAVATAVAAQVRWADMVFPVEIRVSSGAVLTVDPRDPAGPFLTGPVCEVFRGEVG